MIILYLDISSNYSSSVNASLGCMQYESGVNSHICAVMSFGISIRTGPGLPDFAIKKPVGIFQLNLRFFLP